MSNITSESAHPIELVVHGTLLVPAGVVTGIEGGWQTPLATVAAPVEALQEALTALGVALGASGFEVDVSMGLRAGAATVVQVLEDLGE